jgi:ATP-dependent Clp protease ATP-binding subunit ClpX
MSETKTNLDCSFCGKNSTEVKKLIEGPGIFICDECVDLCYGIINKPSNDAETSDPDFDFEEEDDGTPTPRKIKNHLDQYVIGQDEAKMAIAVAVYNHYKRIEHPEIDGVEIDKSNILMLGPTGSGKTLIAQTIARMLDVPLAIADATSLTEAGYVGEEVDSVITRLMQSARFNVKAAERGIIFIDEIDKKRTGANGGGSRDVSGEGVQQALLKLLEGTDVMVPAGGKKGPGAELMKVNTKNILFILGGAFVGLEKHIERGLSPNAGAIGFGAKSVGKPKFTASELLNALQPDHLVKYGMIPELIGRLPVYAVLEELTEDQLVTILTEPKNALVRQFAASFSMDDIELEFTPEALRAIAKIAKDRKTGARGLRSVVEHRLKHTQFELPELADAGVYKVIVNADVISGTQQPERVIMPMADDDDLLDTFTDLLPDAEVKLAEKSTD